MTPKLILDLYKRNPEWIEWEPETIWAEFNRELPSTGESHEIRREQKDMILAVKLCLSNDMPWDQWNVFDKVAISFNDKIAIFDIMQAPSLGEISFAVEMMKDIRASEFSEEIRSYVAAVAKDEGFLVMPDNLQFCQERLNYLNRKFVRETAEVKLAWMLAKITGNIKSGSDDDMVTVQCTKLMAVDKYVKSKKD